MLKLWFNLPQPQKAGRQHFKTSCSSQALVKFPVFHKYGGGIGYVDNRVGTRGSRGLSVEMFRFLLPIMLVATYLLQSWAKWLNT